jgi:hypothetical protein
VLDQHVFADECALTLRLSVIAVARVRWPDDGAVARG